MDWIDDYQAARAEALHRRMERSHEWWAEYMESLNERTAKILYKENSLMLWIALAASALVGVFYRG